MEQSSPPTSRSDNDSWSSLSNGKNELDVLLQDFEMNPIEEMTTNLFDGIDEQLLVQVCSDTESITEAVNISPDYQVSTETDTPELTTFDMMSETVIIISSDDEFEVDDPEEVTTSAKRGCSPKSTPDRKKNVQVVYDEEEKEEEKDDNFEEGNLNISAEVEFGEYDEEEYEDIDDDEENIEQEEELNQEPDNRPANELTTKTSSMRGPSKNAPDRDMNESIISISSDDEFEVDDSVEMGSPSYIILNISDVGGRPSINIPGREKNTKDDDEEFEEVLPKKGRVVFDNLATPSSKKCERVEKIPSATVTTSVKQGCSPKSTSDRKKNVQVVDDEEEEEEEKYYSFEEDNLDIDAEDEEKFEECNEEEYQEIDYEEELNQGPDNKPTNKLTAKTSSKRGWTSTNIPGREKNTKDDDEEVEEVLLKKRRVLFDYPVTLSSNQCEKVEKIPSTTVTTSAKRGCSPDSTPDRKNVQVVHDKEEKEEEENKEFGDYDEEEYEDIDDEEERIEQEEELNQGPDDRPANKFTLGAFVVLKTEMISKENPPVWKIDGDSLLRKYIPFEQDGKVLYRSTKSYSGWNYILKCEYYDAPISFILQTKEEHVIEFFKNKVKKDPEAEDATTK